MRILNTFDCMELSGARGAPALSRRGPPAAPPAALPAMPKATGGGGSSSTSLPSTLHTNTKETCGVSKFVSRSALAMRRREHALACRRLRNAALRRALCLRRCGGPRLSGRPPQGGRAGAARGRRGRRLQPRAAVSTEHPQRLPRGERRMRGRWERKRKGWKKERVHRAGSGGSRGRDAARCFEATQPRSRRFGGPATV